MNRRQKIVVMIGSGVALLTPLFLPIYNIDDNDNPTSSTYYIFLPGITNLFAYFETQIDAGRLAVELIAIIVITVAGYRMFRTR